MEGRSAFQLWIALEMPRPFPGLPFIFGERRRKRIAAGFEIVVDQQPGPIAQSDSLDAGAGVRQLGVLGRRPGYAIVARDASVNALGRRPVVAHERDQRSIFPSYQR